MAMDPVVFHDLLTQLKENFTNLLVNGDAVLLSIFNRTNIGNTKDVEELIEAWEGYEALYNSYIEVIMEILPMENLAPAQIRELDTYCNEVMDQCAIQRHRIEPFMNRYLENQQATLEGIFNSDNNYNFFQPGNIDTPETPVESKTWQYHFH